MSTSIKQSVLIHEMTSLNPPSLFISTLLLLDQRRHFNALDWISQLHNVYNYKVEKGSGDNMKRSDMGKYIRDMGDYYNALIRHGWLLPSWSCAMITRPYLDGIRVNKYYCPHKSDRIPNLYVANPPPKEVLLKIWKRSARKMAEEEPDQDDKVNAILATLTLIEQEGKLPDNNWIITCLADVPGPDCEIFQKKYKFQKPPSAL